MPDGQILARTFSPATHLKAPSRGKRGSAPASVAAYQSRHAELLARNVMLQASLERQQMKSADLRNILCSMDVAILCVSRDLKLRLFTGSAGRLLGIGPQQLGVSLSLAGAFGLHATLMAGITAVLGSGIAEEQVVAMPSGQLILCRLLPLRPVEDAKAAIDGVIITFVKMDTVAAHVPPAQVAEHGRGADHGRNKVVPAARYPGLGCDLTPRQQQILGQVLAGHPSKNIAADLGISRRTVENHRAAIMARTGATSLPALARLAVGADVGGDCKQSFARRG